MAGFQVYLTAEARKVAEQRALLEGCNYLVEYKDTRGYGLNVAIVDWVPTGKVWLDPEFGSGGRYLTRESLKFEGRS